MSAAVTTLSSGIVTGVSAGTDTVYYTTVNICGTNIISHAVTVDPALSATGISGSTTVCEAATTTLSPSVAGGTWTSSGAAATVSGGVVTGVSGGSVVITYSITNVCGSASIPTTITVSPLPVAGALSGDTSVCVGATLTLAPTITGGVWTSSALAMVSGGVVTGVAAGSALISYAVSNSCGTAYTTRTITITPMPNAGTVSGATSVCAGSTITLTPTVSGGGWTSSDATLATVAGGVVTGLGGGTATISYEVGNSCGNAYATSTINVTPLPLAGNIVGLDSVCVGDTIYLTDATIDGVWASTVGALASVSSTGGVVGMSPGIDTISYTVSNACGNAVTTHGVYVKSAADCDLGFNLSRVTESRITIFPNPSDGEFVVEIEGRVNQATIAVLDMYGKLLSQETLIGKNHPSIPVSVSSFPKGTYLVKVVVDGVVHLQKVEVW
jgi:hypothetical protein